MGNRSRYLAIGAAAAGGAIAARRRARLRRMAEGIRDTILPTHVTDLPSERAQGADVAHAPGHQHLPPVADEAPPTQNPLPPGEQDGVGHPLIR